MGSFFGLPPDSSPDFSRTLHESAAKQLHSPAIYSIIETRHITQEETYENSRDLYRRSVQRQSRTGGWGAILRYGTAEKELSGGEHETTNNRMELSGVIAALSALKEPCHVLLTTDSKYVVDSVTKGWVYGWQKRGWVKSDKKTGTECRPVENSCCPCWKSTRSPSTGSKGHAGHPENERCDQLAVMQRDRNA